MAEESGNSNGSKSSLLHKIVDKLADAFNKKFKEQQEKEQAAKQAVLDEVQAMCDLLRTVVKDGTVDLHYQGSLYSKMKEIAAKLQALADKADAAGMHELAEKLRNNPLQTAIDQIPNFDQLASTIPGKYAGPLFGDDMAIPSEPVPIPDAPGESDESEAPPSDEAPGAVPPQSKPAPIEWDVAGDPIRKAAFDALKPEICELAAEPLPPPKPIPTVPTVVWISIAVAIMTVCCGIPVILGGSEVITLDPLNSLLGIPKTTDESDSLRIPPLVDDVGKCFDACDPASPHCAEGLSCQSRADGSHICYSVRSCQQQFATEPPVSGNPALPESGCICQGTTLVCADGTVAEFNPQCGVGGGSSCNLTKASCEAQGYYDVDMSTCTCLGKP